MKTQTNSQSANTHNANVANATRKRGSKATHQTPAANRTIVLRATRRRVAAPTHNDKQELLFTQTTPLMNQPHDNYGGAANHRTATHNALLKGMAVVKRLSHMQFHPLRWLSHIIRAPFIALRQRLKFSFEDKVLLILIATIVLTTIIASSCVKLWEEEHIEIHPLPTTNVPTTPVPWEPAPTENPGTNQ